MSWMCEGECACAERSKAGTDKACVGEGEKVGWMQGVEEGGKEKRHRGLDQMVRYSEDGGRTENKDHSHSSQSQQ